MHDKKDYSDCKKWLEEKHPELFTKIYGPVEEKKEGEEDKSE
jgi:hypothetical protein